MIIEATIHGINDVYLVIVGIGVLGLLIKPSPHLRQSNAETNRRAEITQ